MSVRYDRLEYLSTRIISYKGIPILVYSAYDLQHFAMPRAVPQQPEARVRGCDELVHLVHPWASVPMPYTLLGIVYYPIIEIDSSLLDM